MRLDGVIFRRFAEIGRRPFLHPPVVPRIFAVFPRVRASMAVIRIRAAMTPKPGASPRGPPGPARGPRWPLHGISRAGQGAGGPEDRTRGELPRHDNRAFVLQPFREDLGGLDGAQQGACEDDGGGDAGLADPAGDLPESEPAFRVRYREASGIVPDRSIASAWRTRYSFIRPSEAGG